jgi:hypothetical protein
MRGGGAGMIWTRNTACEESIINRNVKNIKLSLEGQGSELFMIQIYKSMYYWNETFSGESVKVKT